MSAFPPGAARAALLHKMDSQLNVKRGLTGYWKRMVGTAPAPSVRSFMIAKVRQKLGIKDQLEKA